MSGTVDPDVADPQIVNTVSVASTTPDPTPGNNTDESAITLVAVADVSVEKTNGPGPVNAGGPISWTVVISNDGPSAARNVTVTDTLPTTGISDVAVTGAPAGVCDVSDVEIICDVAVLQPGAVGRSP